MLVLTRKRNQSIMIGDEVEVTVLAVSKDKIRLGITAPREIPIFRKEVFLSIKRQQEADSHGDDGHGRNGHGDGRQDGADDESVRRAVESALGRLANDD